MLIGASKDEPDVADLMKNRNEEEGSDDGEEDNQEGMGDVNLEEDVVAVDDDSDEEAKK